MNLPIFQIDAFTDKMFAGNPAAVIPVKEMLDADLMQNIAMENNLAETAFICLSNNKDADYDIRWFTPLVEIDLCGHATLASAFVIFQFLGYTGAEIRFHCQSGILKASKEGDKIWMDFPSWIPEPFIDYPPGIKEALGGVNILNVFKHRDLLVELEDEDAVKNCKPDFALINRSDYKVIITAVGNKTDFVSRFFAPTVGIDEDPATGSAHAQLIPFWSERLGKYAMTSLQLSQRGAAFECALAGDRVKMGGNCVYYMKGEISLP